MFRSHLIVLLSLAYGLFALPAHAVIFFQAEAGGTVAQGSAPVSVLNQGGTFGTPGGPQLSLLASASADRGVLRAKSRSESNFWPSPFGVHHGACNFTVDDLVISGPPSPAFVHAILHMVLDGKITTTTPQTWSAFVNVSISGFTTTTTSGSMSVDLTGTWASSGILSGQLAPGTVSLPIDLDLGMVLVNAPVGSSQASMTANVEAGVGLNNPDQGSTANSNFFDAGGLHFPRADLKANPSWRNSGGETGLVFTLPPGYTANSPSLNIVDNVWGGGAVSVRPETWSAVKNLWR